MRVVFPLWEDFSEEAERGRWSPPLLRLAYSQCVCAHLCISFSGTTQLERGPRSATRRERSLDILAYKG